MPHVTYTAEPLKWGTGNPPPKKRMLAAVGESATDNENSGTLNLVYPFWWTTGFGGGGTGSGPSITVDPSGPLNLENGVLSIQTANPITTSGGALRLSIDGNTLALSSQLQLTVKAAAPLVKGNGGGVTLNYDTSMFGLNSKNGQFQLLLDQNGPLSSSPNGLTLNVNPTYFSIANGQLTSNVPQYVSPYAVFEVTSERWNNYVGKVQSNANTTWNVSYRILIVNAAGLCNGIANIALPRPSGSVSAPVSFTFVLTFAVGTGEEGVTNLSNLNTPVVTPSGGNSYFYPSSKQEVGSYLGVNPGNWYVPMSTKGMTLISFNPIGVGSTSFGTASCAYSQASLNILEGAVPPAMLVFTYSVPITDGSWSGNTGSSTDLLVTGPLSFSYQGASYPAT
ncbi:MAG: fiber 1 protein [Psittacine adenovirus 12]